jgi:hypothetical protein
VEGGGEGVPVVCLVLLWALEGDHTGVAFPTRSSPDCCNNSCGRGSGSLFLSDPLHSGLLFLTLPWRLGHLFRLLQLIQFDLSLLQTAVSGVPRAAVMSLTDLFSALDLLLLLLLHSLRLLPHLVFVLFVTRGGVGGWGRRLRRKRMRLLVVLSFLAMVRLLVLLLALRERRGDDEGDERRREESRRSSSRRGQQRNSPSLCFSPIHRLPPPRPPQEGDLRPLPLPQDQAGAGCSSLSFSKLCPLPHQRLSLSPLHPSLLLPLTLHLVLTVQESFLPPPRRDGGLWCEE